MLGFLLVFALFFSLILPFFGNLPVPGSVSAEPGDGGVSVRDDVITIARATAGNTFTGNVGMVQAAFLADTGCFYPWPTTDVANTLFTSETYNRYWHTEANPNPADAWVLLELDKVENIEKIFIWNHNATFGNEVSGERDAKDIDIFYSADSTNGTNGSWTKLGSYVLPRTAGDNRPVKPQFTADFGRQARFIRIKLNSVYGSGTGFWGLGRVLFTRVKSPTSDLRVRYTEIKAMEFFRYTEGSWKALANYMEIAKALINTDSDDIQAIAEVSAGLETAIANLIPKQNLARAADGVTAHPDSYYEFHTMNPRHENYGKPTPDNEYDYVRSIAEAEGAKTLDESFNTRWWSRKFVYETYIIYDLKESKTFNQIIIGEQKNDKENINEITISYSDDSKAWDDGSKLWTKWRERTYWEPYCSIVGEAVTARYIRVDFTACNYGQGIRLAVFMAFNDPTATQTIEPPDYLQPPDPDRLLPVPADGPTPYQNRKINDKFGIFLHYSINTFIDQEWSMGNYPARTYDPDNDTLDPEQWVRAAWEGGINYVVAITKHHDGFAMWPTKQGTYNIGYTGRAHEERNVIKEVADACKKYGIRMGIYYSLWDAHWDSVNTMDSRGFESRTEMKIAYNDYANAQLTELFNGDYGEICELWLDGSWEKRALDWELERLYDTVKRLQPSCQVTNNPTLEDWNGNDLVPDQAKGGEPIKYFPSDFRIRDPHYTKQGANADPKLYSHKGELYWMPFELTKAMIPGNWYWSTKNNPSRLTSAASIVTAYNWMIPQKNTVLLNIAPNNKGLLEDYEVQRLYEAARLLGIERGGARTNIPADECAVQIRFVTEDGHIANATRYLYGNAGEAYHAVPDDLAWLGYELTGRPQNAQGTFTEQKIVVEFVYRDWGDFPIGAATVDNLKFDRQTVEMNPGGREKLTLTYAPMSLSVPISWRSSDPEVAAANNAGVITAKKEGIAVISAETPDGKKVSCTVTVGTPPPKYGHVSGGDTLGITDARLVLQHIVEKIQLTPEQQDIADVDGDQKVTINDARLILQRLVDKIDKFPREV